MSLNILTQLPTLIVYITDQCNSRCVMCDYWRTGRTFMSLELAERVADEVRRAGTRRILLSGGEPLLHHQWSGIATMFRSTGAKVSMATSGLLLSRYSEAICEVIDKLYISIDGASAESYRAIRGVDGLDAIGRAVRSISAVVPVTCRTTVQRLNYREMPDLVRLSHSWGASHHSFLPVDVVTRHAFGRAETPNKSLSLTPTDVEKLMAVLDILERECEDYFQSGYIAESPDRLRNLLGHFRVSIDGGRHPLARCNAPAFSAVLEADGALRPCFFLPSTSRMSDCGLIDSLNVPDAISIRHEQAAGAREECRGCVCPIWREQA